MKIIYYTKNLNRPNPGAQKSGKKLIKSLVKNNDSRFEYHIVTDFVEKGQNINLPGKIYQVFKHRPIKIPILDFFLKNFFVTRYILKLAYKIKPNIIHFQSYAGYVYVKKKTPLNYKVLITYRDHPGLFFIPYFYKNPINFIDFLWNFIACRIRYKNMKSNYFYHVLSYNSKDFLIKLGIDEKNIFLLHNGTNRVHNEKKYNKLYLKETICQIFGIKPKSKLILMVGAIIHRKGIHFTIESLRELPKDYHLILAGKPNLIGWAYFSKIIDSETKKRIHYLGFINKRILNFIYLASDIYISTSISEGCQMTVFEAIERKLPFIVSEAGASKDFFNKSENIIHFENQKYNKPYIMLNCPFVFRSLNKNTLKEKILKKESIFDNYLREIPDWDEISRKLNQIYLKIALND